MLRVGPQHVAAMAAAFAKRPPLADFSTVRKSNAPVLPPACRLALALGVVAWLAHHYGGDYIGRLQQKIGAMEFWGGALSPALTARAMLLLPAVCCHRHGLLFRNLVGFAAHLIGNVAVAAVSFSSARKLGRVGWLENSFSAASGRLSTRLWPAMAEDASSLVSHPLFPSSLLHINLYEARVSIRHVHCYGWHSGRRQELFFTLFRYHGAVRATICRGKPTRIPSNTSIWLAGGLTPGHYHGAARADRPCAPWLQAEKGARKVDSPDPSENQPSEPAPGRADA